MMMNKNKTIILIFKNKHKMKNVKRLKRARLLKKERNKKVPQFKLRPLTNEEMILIIILAIAGKNLGKLKVSRKYHGLSDSELVTFAYGIVFTGDPDATTPYNTDSQLQAAADTLRDALSAKQTNPSKTATSNCKAARKTLLQMLDEDAGYVEIVANKVSVGKGDLEKGKAVIYRIGYAATGKGTGLRRYGFVNFGPGWMHVREKKAKKGTEGHVWEVGIPTAKNTPPQNVIQFFSFEAECIFNNIPSGSYLAYRHASIIPVGRKTSITGTSTPVTPSTEKAVSMSAQSIDKHIMFDINKPATYQFSDWKYQVGL